MTWIVGMATIFGQTVGISDVRVSGPDGESYGDCLQKVYPVGRDIALAFAGSVSIGFRMVWTLHRLLADCPPGQAWEPEMVAEWWPEVARSVFESATTEERDAGCHLMMLSVHPNKNVGPGWAQAYVHVFRSPTFEAISVPAHQAASIGYGAVETTCVEALRRLTQDENEQFALMKIAGMVPQAMGPVFAHSISRHIAEHSPQGISLHLNICLVTRGQIVIVNNDYTTYEAAGPVKFTMPKLARSPNELSDMLDGSGLTAAELTAR